MNQQQNESLAQEPEPYKAGDIITEFQNHLYRFGKALASTVGVIQQAAPPIIAEGASIPEDYQTQLKEWGLGIVDSTYAMLQV